MTVAETLTDLYRTLESAAVPIFAACAAVPIGGTLAAWIGRGGRTDRDGRFFANMVIGFGLLVFVLEVLVLLVARWAFDASVLDANVFLLIGPVLALVLGLLGVRLVFPLSALGSARTARSALLLVGLTIVIIWLLGQFRGWGVVFVGGIAQLGLLLALGWLLLRGLAKKTFGKGDGKDDGDVDGRPRPPPPRRR